MTRLYGHDKKTMRVSLPQLEALGWEGNSHRRLSARRCTGATTPFSPPEKPAPTAPRAAPCQAKSPLRGLCSSICRRERRRPRPSPPQQREVATRHTRYPDLLVQPIGRLTGHGPAGVGVGCRRGRAPQVGPDQVDVPGQRVWGWTAICSKERRESGTEE